jgi:hypothetical protein
MTKSKVHAERDNVARKSNVILKIFANDENFDSGVSEVAKAA